MALAQVFGVPDTLSVGGIFACFGRILNKTAERKGFDEEWIPPGLLALEAWKGWNYFLASEGFSLISKACCMGIDGNSCW